MSEQMYGYREDHERYHKHGPSSDPYDVERRELRHSESFQHVSPFVRRALAAELPAKELGR